jgi:hypothetical protein
MMVGVLRGWDHRVVNRVIASTIGRLEVESMIWRKAMHRFKRVGTIEAGGRSPPLDARAQHHTQARCTRAPALLPVSMIVDQS